jgi:TIR domain
MSDKIEIFICYAHEDRTWLIELENTLSTMERQGLIQILHDLKISAGSDRENEINTFLKAAPLILLLVSSDFIASEQCYRVAEQAMEKFWREEARVIPILLHESDWEYTLFGKLTPLPTNGRPMSAWTDRNAAFLDVIKGIRKIIQDLSSTASQSSTQQPTQSRNSRSQQVSISDAAPTGNLTLWQRRNLEQKRDETWRLWDIRNKKIQRIKQALAIENDVTTIIKYETQLSQEEPALAGLTKELEDIEQALQ